MRVCAYARVPDGARACVFAYAQNMGCDLGMRGVVGMALCIPIACPVRLPGHVPQRRLTMFALYTLVVITPYGNLVVSVHWG